MRINHDVTLTRVSFSFGVWNSVTPLNKASLSRDLKPVRLIVLFGVTIYGDLARTKVLGLVCYITFCWLNIRYTVCVGFVLKERRMLAKRVILRFGVVCLSPRFQQCVYRQQTYSTCGGLFAAVYGIVCRLLFRFQVCVLCAWGVRRHIVYCSGVYRFVCEGCDGFQ